MSDQVLKLIPKDSIFIPPKISQDAAVAELEELTDGELCESLVHSKLEFIDQGENLETIICSECKSELDIDHFSENTTLTWWYEVEESLVSSSADDLNIIMPCCHKEAGFKSLEFRRPAGFSIYELKIWNPDIAGPFLEERDLQKIESILGTKLVQISAHY